MAFGKHFSSVRTVANSSSKQTNKQNNKKIYAIIEFISKQHSCSIQIRIDELNRSTYNGNQVMAVVTNGHEWNELFCGLQMNSFSFFHSVRNLNQTTLSCRLILLITNYSGKNCRMEVKRRKKKKFHKPRENKQSDWMKSINKPISAFLIRIKSLQC